MDERQLYEREEPIGLGVRALQRLRADVAAGDTSPGGLLLYRGAAGFGKTSLLGRLRAAANADRGSQILLFARATEQQRGAPFHVARSLLQPTLAKMQEAERREMFGGWYDIAAPALGLTPADAGNPADPTGVQEALSWVMTQLAVRQGPLLVVVDDLHWADPESGQWLAGYLGQIQHLPMLVSLAYRSDELAPAMDDVLLREVREMGTRGHVVELQKLSPNAVEAMVRGRLGEDADDVFCRTCWSITNGNPFFVTSLIDRLSEQGVAPVEENQDQLRALAALSGARDIGRRLERLGTDVQRTAFAAAVLDTPFDLELISRVAGLPFNQAQTAVEKLTGDQILVRSGHEFHFSHPTVASAVYQSITFPAMRTSIHSKAADEVIASGRGGMAAASRHLIELYPDDNPAVVQQLRQAAHEHLAMGAPDAAKRCLERALREPPADEDLAEVRYELGCAVMLRDPDLTVRQLQLALDELPGLEPEHRLNAVLRLGQALTHSNRVTEAVELTRDEVARMTDGPAKTRLQAASFMWRLLRRNDPDGKETSRQLALLVEQQRGRTDPEARSVQVLRARDLTLRGESSSEALAFADLGTEGGRPAEGLGWTNQVLGFEVPVMLGVAYIYNDRLDRARNLFVDAAYEFELMGWSGGHLGFANFFQALVMFRQGKLEDAEKALKPTLRKARGLGPNNPLLWDVVAVLCDIRLAQGRLDEAAKLAEEHGIRPGQYPPAAVLPDAPALVARLLLAQGRTREAVAELERHGRELDERGWENTVWSPWVSTLALALADSDPERARALAADAYGRALRAGTNSAEGMALHAWAKVAEPEKELELLRRAVSALGQSPIAFEHASALVDYGAALRRDGRLREAVAALEQGLDIARDCGAIGLVDRARRELKASGVSPHRLRPLPSRDLTALQLRSAQLTAEGKDRGEVAEVLSVSPARVAELLAAVYRTLGTDAKGLAETLKDDPGVDSE
ncbi:ATP-binding protein [Streptacidiphilus pinicola]|uniref:ATP-binding protein n=1 Tax=Streptacidiphilus pinicola TaxID=2219663 RepID=A0A2X0IW18_9ACTN|nr:AAA family ATPase [Streptacidiphilus pinicola]RAG87683.1 ATP-binding protein [Streptacidiphilus pinicola]